MYIFCLYKKWDQTFADYSVKVDIGLISMSLNINQLLHFDGSTLLHLQTCSACFSPEPGTAQVPQWVCTLLHPLPAIKNAAGNGSLCAPAVLSAHACRTMEQQARSVLTSCHPERRPHFTFSQAPLRGHLSRRSSSIGNFPFSTLSTLDAKIPKF